MTEPSTAEEIGDSAADAAAQQAAVKAVRGVIALIQPSDANATVEEQLRAQLDQCALFVTAVVEVVSKVFHRLYFKKEWGSLPRGYRPGQSLKPEEVPPLAFYAMRALKWHPYSLWPTDDLSTPNTTLLIRQAMKEQSAALNPDPSRVNYRVDQQQFAFVMGLLKELRLDIFRVMWNEQS